MKLDPDKLEQLADWVDVTHPEWPVLPLELKNLAPQLAREHAALLRWAETAREAIASVDHSDLPCEGKCVTEREQMYVQMKGPAVLAALDELQRKDSA